MSFKNSYESMTESEQRALVLPRKPVRLRAKSEIMTQNTGNGKITTSFYDGDGQYIGALTLTDDQWLAFRQAVQLGAEHVQTVTPFLFVHEGSKEVVEAIMKTRGMK